jgi:hypothetical protein
MFPGGHVAGNVAAFTVLDGELYLAGSFDRCMGRLTNNVAKWDGRRWSVLGDGVGRLSQAVNALVVFDDPNSTDGPAVFAGGQLGVHKWVSDGSRWDQVGDLDADGTVYALAVCEGAL